MGFLQTSAARRRENLEKKIRQRRIAPAEAETLRGLLERRIQREVEEKRAEFREQARQMGFAGRVALSATTGLLSAGNRMTFGMIPRLVGMASLGEQTRFDIAQQAREAEAPSAAMAGNIAGFFAPGPLRGLTMAAGKGAAYPLAKIASKDALAGRIFARTLAQTGGNVMAGTGAIGASVLTDFTTNASLDERFDAIKDSLNPSTLSGAINIGLAGVTGVAQSGIRQKVDRGVAKMIEEAKRILGPRFRVSPDIPRSDSGLALIFSNIANLPGGRGIARKFLRKTFFEPMDDVLRRMEGRFRSSASVARVSRSLRDIRGAEEGAIGERGAITRQRKGMQSRALQQEGRLQLTDEERKTLLYAIRDARKNLSKQDRARLTSTVSTVISRFGKAVGAAKKKGEGVSVQEVEDFRAGLAWAVKLGRRNPELVTDVDQRMLGAAFRAINESFRQTAPRYAEAQEAATFLHAIRRIMPGAKLNDPEDVIRAHFSGKDVASRWRVIENYLPRDEVQALRGWYLAKFIEHVTPRDGTTKLINMPTMKNAFRGKAEGGMFWQDIFDAVLPNMRSDFINLGDISYRVAQGLGRAEGAQTGARFAVMAGMTFLAGLAGLTGSILFQDAELSEKLKETIGPIGYSIVGATLVASLGRSVFGGAIANQLNRGALGQPLYGPTRTAAAAQQFTGGGLGGQP